MSPTTGRRRVRLLAGLAAVLSLVGAPLAAQAYTPPDLDITIDCDDYDAGEYPIVIGAYQADEYADPDGQRLYTRDITIPLDPQELFVEVPDEPDDNDMWIHTLGGDPSCQLWSMTTGAHVYGTLSFTITQAGTYTFRGIDSDPLSSDLVFGSPVYPIADPFLAVYRDFDPSQPDDGVIGCNDDFNHDYDGFDAGASYIPDLGDQVIPGRQSAFTAYLEPGSYSLVLLTFLEIDAEMWDAGDDGWNGPGAFAARAQSVTFELWGVPGGLLLDDLKITSPATTTSATPAITGTSSAPAGSVVTVTVAGQTLTTTVGEDGTWSVTPAALAAGSHQVVVTITLAGEDVAFISANQVLVVDLSGASGAGAKSKLAATGSTSAPLTVLAGGLLLAGAVVVTGRRFARR